MPRAIHVHAVRAALLRRALFTTGLLGVTFCFHRCLTHRSFVLPKPVEYFCAYCGVLASQSDPIEWVSHHRLVCPPRLRALFSCLPRTAAKSGWECDTHGGLSAAYARPGVEPHCCVWERVEDARKRALTHDAPAASPPLFLLQHHAATDTATDPHSPLQSGWWSHAGWLLDRAAIRGRLKLAGVGAAGEESSNVKDLQSQWFYVFMEQTYELHILSSAVALYYLGGWPYLAWGYGLRTVAVWHATFAVNSLCHIWGGQPYVTGDESRNNTLVAMLAFGEGWHNNHHAFSFSARHGLEWWQFDSTWVVICILQFLGLATQVKVPSDAQKHKMLARNK